MFQLAFLACGKIRAQCFAISTGWKMWHDEFAWPESTPGTEGTCLPGWKDTTDQGRGTNCCQGRPFCRAPTPSPSSGLGMGTGSLRHGFRTSVLRDGLPSPSCLVKLWGLEGFSLRHFRQCPVMRVHTWHPGRVSVPSPLCR